MDKDIDEKGNLKPIQSPCVSNCCLDDKDICLGCYRHIDEITGWHSADHEQRKRIINSTDLRRAEHKKQKTSPF
jgi:uncharacterized protein